MALEDNYPELRDRIATARQYGYSDDEILAGMSPEQRSRGGQAAAPAPSQGMTAEELQNQPSMLGRAARFVTETALPVGGALGGGVLGPAIAGTLVGGPIGGAVGAAAGALGAAGGAGIGEWLRQMIFDKEVKPSTIAYAAATGWIPGLKFEGVTAPLARLGLKATEGGVFGGVFGEGRKAIEQGKEYSFDPGDTAMNTLLGAAFGAGFEKLFPSLPRETQAKLAAVKSNLTSYVDPAYLAMAKQLADPAQHMALLKSGAAKLNAGQPLSQPEAWARGTVPSQWAFALAPEVSGAGRPPPPSTPVPDAKQLATMYSAGRMSADKVADIMGMSGDPDLANRMMAQGVLTNQTMPSKIPAAGATLAPEALPPGVYQLAKPPPEAPKAKGPPVIPQAAPGRPTGDAPAGLTPQQEFIWRYKHTDEQGRANMERGIKYDDPLWSQMAQARREMNIAGNDAAAKQEWDDLVTAANTLSPGPAKDAAISRLADMGYDVVRDKNLNVSGATAAQKFAESVPKVRPRTLTAEEEQASLQEQMFGKETGYGKGGKLKPTTGYEPLRPEEEMQQAAQRAAEAGQAFNVPGPEEAETAIPQPVPGTTAQQQAAAPPNRLQQAIANYTQRLQDRNLKPDERAAIQAQIDSLKAQAGPTPQTAPPEGETVAPEQQQGINAAIAEAIRRGKEGETAPETEAPPDISMTKEAVEPPSEAPPVTTAPTPAEVPPAVKPEPAAAKPAMITRDQTKQLADLGYSRDQIARMKPQEAQDILDQEELLAARLRQQDELTKLREKKAEYEATLRGATIRKGLEKAGFAPAGGPTPEERASYKAYQDSQPPEVAQEKAQKLYDQTTDPLRSPAATPQDLAGMKQINDDVASNPQYMDSEIERLKYGKPPEQGAPLTQKVIDRTAEFQQKIKAFADRTDEEIRAELANPNISGFEKRLYAAEMDKRIHQEAMNKPVPIQEKIQQELAKRAEFAKSLGLTEEQYAKMSVDDLIALAKTPRGGAPIGTMEAAEQERAFRQRAQDEELFRKLFLEARQNGLTIEQAAARHGIPYSNLDRIFSNYFYGSKTYSWENIEQDVLRNRVQERDTAARVYTEAKRPNVSYETAAQNLGIDPAEWRNLQYELKLDDALKNVAGTLRDVAGFNERAKFLMAEAPAIEQTGTMRPGSKETAREAVRPDEDTYRRKISEAGFDKTRSGIVDSLNEIKSLAAQQAAAGQGLTARDAARIRDEAANWVKAYNRYSDLWFKDRMAWGRIGKAQQRPPVPADLVQFLTDVGQSIDQWRAAKVRTPIYTSLWNAMRPGTNSLIGYKSMTPSERFEVQSNMVNALRLNVFPATTASLDAILDFAETATQGVGALGSDIAHGFATGKWAFPHLNAYKFAWKNATTSIQNKLLMPEFEEAMRFTAGGEPVPGNVRIRDVFQRPTAEGNWMNFFQTGKPGAFTERSTQASAALDTLAGLPLYTKGAVDNFFKRIAGTYSMYSDGLLAAEKAGIPVGTLQHQQFMDDFWRNIPQANLRRGIDAANAAGFSRELPAIAERISRSKTGQLFLEAFGRFPWQFMKWTGDMIGINPALAKKFGSALKSGDWSNISPEEVGRYIARTATGIGGLALIDSIWYDRTDFNSMEFLDKDGNRQRLGSREPIASGLFLDALIRGDWAKAQQAARYASFPLIKILYGGGGLMSNMLVKGYEANLAGRSLLSDKQFYNEFVDTVNHAIPGQAILAALKTATDPIVREGFGAALPGVSQFVSPKIDVTTGEPLQVTQHFPFAPNLSMRAVQGTPIPGMFREMNPVAQMLNNYGFTTYRGNRLPIAGKYPAEAPQEVDTEWQQEFGKLRWQLQSQLAPIVKQIEARTPPDQLRPPAEGQTGSPIYEAIRAKIASYDSMAARQANQIINARYNTPGKLPRRATPRELAAPVER